MAGRVALLGNIFISYRRDDAAAYAGRLCDLLSAMAGGDRVFMDVDDIAPGQNFAEAIDRSIAGCATALIVIGPRWAPIMSERSAAGDTDYVRHEVASALAHKLRIIPVLVGGAKMPVAADLPAAMADLPLHQAFELRDSTFKEDAARLAATLNLSRPPNKRRRVWALVGVIALMAALIGLVGFARVANRKSEARADPRLATARTQMELGEPQSAFRTYGEVLQGASADPSVMDLQADAAMAWLRDYHVAVTEGQKAEDIAGPQLAAIIQVLEAALARTGGAGKRAADVLAHLGWAHWLNRRIAAREFGDAPQQAFRKALAADPTNVYGNAMMGNWLLQSNGSTAEALRCFEAAERAGSQREFVRRMELSAMTYRDDRGIPAAVMRIVNQMRINQEPLDNRMRQRVLSNFAPGHQAETEEMLTAVPPPDVWATFEWLAPSTPGDEKKFEGFRRDYVRARVTALEGKAEQSAALLRDLQSRMKAVGMDGRLADEVAAALKQLSSGAAR
ncbi:MAG: toll/interleukin-1 receptor domain-containing protein [Bryobacterales bacterium]|nr:toll/interleukin-1 receptor domain-containing protein [Bryobacterales bacterium]